MGLLLRAGVIWLLVGSVCCLEVNEINNAILGDPEIECGSTSLTVNVNTRNEFEGHIYVKGLYEREECRNDDGGSRRAGIGLSFDSCQVSRTRSLNPRGVYVTTTVIVSFHPLFVTSVDKAYRVQCFYMEADKTVDTGLAVSILTTQAVSQTVPMPTCRYQVLDGSATGDVVRFASVGQKVYHKWSCDTETVDTFCMIVRSCFVDDSKGDRVDLVDEFGCAKDRTLLPNLEYHSDLMAGVEARVFKYADRPRMAFQCQITLLVKEPNDECPRPFCPKPAGKGAGSANPEAEDAGPPPKHPFPLVEGSPYLPSGSRRILPRLDRKPSTTIRSQKVTKVPAPINRYHAGPPSARYQPVRPLELRYSRRRYRRDARETGTIDVRTEIDTLDITERVPGLPEQQSSGYLSGRGVGICMPPVLFGLFICLSSVLLIAAVSFWVFLASHSNRRNSQLIK